MISYNAAVLLAPCIPIMGAIGMVCLSRWPNLRESMTLITTVVLFINLCGLIPDTLHGSTPEIAVLSFLPGLGIAFKVEPLGLVFAVLASGLWIVSSIYSIGYVRGNALPRQTAFYVWFAVSLGATMGIALAANLFTLFLFYETLTFVTYPLVVHDRTEVAKAAGRIYLGILLGASISLFLFALIWTWRIAGTFDFRLGGILLNKADSTSLGILLALFVFGIAKAALMPVHRWLPAAMVAPVPVSALLHAVAVVKAGVFSITKILVYIFGFDLLMQIHTDDWLIYVASFSIIAASVIALYQNDLKRRLAYSTISQLGYVVLAAAMAHPLALLGAGLHIIGHAFGKITLFFAAGSIYTTSRQTSIPQIKGLGRRMPWTMGAFAVGTLCIIGFPGTAGFWGKWYIFQAASAMQQPFIIVALVLSTLLSAGYLIPIVYSAFFQEIPKANVVPKEAPWLIILALVISSLGVFGLFFAAELPFQLISLIRV